MDLRAKRIQKFKSLSQDLYYGKFVKRLKPQDIEICLDWLEEFGNSEDFGKHVNRIFLESFQDRKQNKTKDSLIWELLSLCNKVK